LLFRCFICSSECNYAGCHDTECHYAECYPAEFNSTECHGVKHLYLSVILVVKEPEKVSGLAGKYLKKVRVSVSDNTLAYLFNCKLHQKSFIKGTIINRFKIAFIKRCYSDESVCIVHLKLQQFQPKLKLFFYFIATEHFKMRFQADFNF
jgi:hypothetical protein